MFNTPVPLLPIQVSPAEVTAPQVMLATVVAPAALLKTMLPPPLALDASAPADMLTERLSPAVVPIVTDADEVKLPEIDRLPLPVCVYDPTASPPETVKLPLPDGASVPPKLLAMLERMSCPLPGTSRLPLPLIGPLSTWLAAVAMTRVPLLTIGAA